MQKLNKQQKRPFVIKLLENIFFYLFVFQPFSPLLKKLLSLFWFLEIVITLRISSMGATLCTMKRFKYGTRNSPLRVVHKSHAPWLALCNTGADFTFSLSKQWFIITARILNLLIQLQYLEECISNGINHTSSLRRQFLWFLSVALRRFRAAAPCSMSLGWVRSSPRVFSGCLVCE